MGKKWTEEEVNFLKQNWDDMTYKRIGEELDRSKQSVQSKARRLGKKKMDSKPPGYWTKKRIIKKLQEFEEKHGKEYLTTTNIHDREIGLWKAAKREFESYSKAGQLPPPKSEI